MTSDEEDILEDCIRNRLKGPIDRGKFPASSRNSMPACHKAHVSDSEYTYSSSPSSLTLVVEDSRYNGSGRIVPGASSARYTCAREGRV